MNHCQVAMTGIPFGNHCLAQGNFTNPGTIIDAIRAASPIEQGVLMISGPSISGRIGILNNKMIVGGIVDGSAEAGIEAVYKLLLQSRGDFLFREATLSDQWDLHQKLYIEASDIKDSLVGAATIGLAKPTVEQSIPSKKEHHDDDDNYPRKKRTVGGISEKPPIIHGIGREVESVNSMFSNGCGSLIDDLIKKQDYTTPIARRRPKRTTESQTLEIVRPKIKKKEQNSYVSPRVTLILVTCIFTSISLASFMITGGSSSAATPSQKTDVSSIYTRTTADKPHSSESKKEAAPFKLPGGPRTVSAPPRRLSPSTGSEVLDGPRTELDTAKVEKTEENNSMDSRDLGLWVQAVRKNPNDPAAREHLAYALLSNNKPDLSVQQFQTALQLKKSSLSEVDNYVDALLVYKHDKLAIHFLQYAMSQDPSLNVLRGKLTSLEQAK